MYTLYSMQRSGNSYKVRLALAHLDVPYRLVEIDILKGESHTPDFLKKNPNGQVPLLEVAPGRYLAESNAILWYVAGGTPLAPDDRIERAQALQWMFFEQHSLEPNLGAAYFWLTLVKGGRDLQQHAFEDWMEEGHRALGVMEKHLAQHDYFAAGHYTIQFAKKRKATVITTVSAPAKAEIARQAGADHVIDYKREDVGERVMAVTGKRGVDAVIEVDLAANARLLPDVLAPNGVVAIYGSGAPAASIPFQFLLQNSITMKFLFVYLMPQEQRARATAEITRMLEGGELVHNVAQSFELGDIVAAHEAVESGKAMGNIVVRIA